MNNIFKGKTVLVTGHTGFKGSWLSIWLNELGADVVGYALEPHTENDNFVVTDLKQRWGMTSIIGDMRNYSFIKRVFDASQPEIVFHLAAQPIVRLSYEQRKETFGINIMGTVNLLECCRKTPSVKVVVNVTSDKCYRNDESLYGFKEDAPLGGRDPYSASKACSELISATYKDSLNIATVRAGNVIGGGDWQVDRIVPDCIRSLKAGKPIGVRNPTYTRPWQFVLEPLYGYLLLASKMWYGNYAGAWNFAPLQPVKVKDLVNLIIKEWGSGDWFDHSLPDQPREDKNLMLDITKAITLLGWQPVLSIEEAVKLTVAWYKHPRPNYSLCVEQINHYNELRHGL